MTMITLDEIWQTIRKSERSDEFQFMDDETSLKAEVARMVSPQRFQADGVLYNPIAIATIRPASNI